MEKFVNLEQEASIRISCCVFKIPPGFAFLTYVVLLNSTYTIFFQEWVCAHRKTSNLEGGDNSVGVVIFSEGACF